jgi:hypothetical protein
MALIGCASSMQVKPRPLTLRSIEEELVSIENLSNCDFYLSKDVFLQAKSQGGDMAMEKITVKKIVTIDKATSGVLQSEKNTNDPSYTGYQLIDDGKKRELSIYVLFEESDDNALKFIANYDNNEDLFKLLEPEIEYGEYKYKLEYGPGPAPFLMYSTKKKYEERKKAKGRRTSGE